MLRYLLFSFLMFLPILGEEPSKEELSSIHIIDQILNAKEIWPGYQISSTATIITFKNGHVFAFGLNSKNPAWHSLSPGIQYADHDEWGATKVPMQSNFFIENKRSFVFQIDHSMEDEFEKPFMVFVHERFHQFQFDAFANMKKPPTAGYRDHMNADNLAFMQLEEKLLLEYLETKNKEKLRDFVAINQTRRNLIDIQSSKHEVEQQMMEGLADYVSIKIFDETPIFNHFKGKKQLTKTLKKYTSHPDITQRSMKWRHYGVGATLGYALDDLKVPNWKDNVQTKSMSQEEQLVKALPMSDEERDARVEYIKATYGFDDLLINTTAVVKAYKNYLDDLMNTYTAQKGIEVTVGRIKYSGQSGGGHSKKLIYMSDGSMLALHDDSFASSSDKAWHLRLDKVPFALKGRGGDITFKVENDLKITLDNHSYSAKELAEMRAPLQFHTISWKGQNTAFGCDNRPGKVNVINQHVIIDFD